ncbi:MAG: hypothetical protein R6U98_11090 [Pirellulaceae bacterium]
MKDVNAGYWMADTVNNVTAFLGASQKGGLLVGCDLYSHGGMRTERPKVRDNKGHEMRNVRRVVRDVARF